MSFTVRCALLLLLIVEAPASPLVVSKLPDGVSISGSTALRQIVATWDIFVTLDPPPYPWDLAEQLDRLDTTLEGISSLRYNTLLLPKDTHQSRRTWIRALLGPTPSKTRTRRGLLDAGGSLLHALFGVATNGQLQRFQAALLEVADRQTDVSHANLQLATIVNQTRAVLRAVVARQQDITVNVLHIDTALKQLGDAAHSQAANLRRVEFMTALDRYLDLLDLAARQYQDQLALYSRQRAGLELGHLTRDLLSPARLRAILTQAATSHHVIDNLSWYYTYLTVTPLWRQQDNLLYKVELPLLATRPYLLYQIAALPVPIANSTLAVTLDLETHYAMDTTSGNIFIPHQCIGHAPVTCQTGPEYDSSMLRCARGLITSRPSLIKHCKASIKDSKGTPPVTTLSLNQYAITTKGESLAIRCPGLPESHMDLSLGTYNVTCLSPCTLQGTGYRITCVDRLFLTKHYTMPAVRVTAHFNFSSLIRIDKLRISLPQLQKADTQPLVDLDAHLLITPVRRFTMAPIRSRPSVLAIINLVVIFTIVLALTTIYWRYRLCPRRRPTVVADTLRGEALPLTSAPQEPPPPQVQSIWPVLPPFSACTNTATATQQ